MSFSTRFALPIAAVALIALIPVVIHDYARVEVDDCRNPRALTPGGEVMLDEDRASWLHKRYQAFAWREGEIRRREAEVHYVIARSFDAKRIYYRPSYAFAQGPDPVSVDLQWLELDGERVPVFESSYAVSAIGQPRQIAFHMLVSEGEPVASPIRHQLESAPRLLLQGRRPMTLLYVDTVALAGSEERPREAALDWLAGAWRNYRAVCS